MALIERQDTEWGVYLTARPFEGHKTLDAMSIRAEISKPKPKRGSVVNISFSAAMTSVPMSLQDAQTWQTAMSAVLSEARQVVSKFKERK